MAKNNKCFLLSIPAFEKYVPMARRYIVEILMAYGLGSGFLYQMETVVDELCGKISRMIKKQTAGVWLDIKFELGKDGLSFDILEQSRVENDAIYKENGILEEFGISSPEICLIEKYSDCARLEMRGGRIANVRMTRVIKVN